MWTKREFTLSITGVLTLGMLGFLLLPGGAAHAQLSCEDIPAPLDADFISRMQDFYTSFENGTRFWTTDFCQFKDGVWQRLAHGGPAPDGIPPIDNPIFEAPDAAAVWLQPQSPVIAVKVNEAARAYPLAILTRHEIVNDKIDGIPVAVTFCPLCNSAIIFNRAVDGETLRFGVSGFLLHSDLIMWDDLTQSWWQQLTGEGIVGSYTGTRLDILPSQVVSFAAFRDQFPDGEVLSRENLRYSPDSYGSNPYVGYDSGDPFFRYFDRSLLDDRLRPTEHVLAGRIGGDTVAYPFSVLEQAPVINDTLGGQAVVALWQPGATSALDSADINSSRDIGMAALFSRELDGQTLTFVAGEDGTITDEQTGSTWNIFGTATDGELAGSQLTQQPAFPHFWFAWVAFEPDTRLYGIE